MHINDLLKIAVERKASDLHLKVGSLSGHPHRRGPDSAGRHAPADAGRHDRDGVLDHVRPPEGEVQEQLRDRHRLQRRRTSAASAATSSSSAARSAWSCASSRPRSSRSRSSCCRPCSRRSAEEQRGLVLCTGTTGSGKSTTLAAMIDHINATRNEHIMTIEDPIEFLHRDKKSIVNQREVDVDTKSLLAGAAQRAAPGPGRHPRRRNARLRDDRDGADRGRDRPPRLLDAPHPGRDRDDQPHHLGLPAAPAEADPPAARRRAEGRHLAAPDAARRRPRPRAGGRGADPHRLHPRLHREQGEDEATSRTRSRRARRSTACRPSTSRSTRSTSRG